MLKNTLILYLLYNPFIIYGTTIPKLNNDPAVPYKPEWRSEIEEARQSVVDQLHNNLIITLNGLANSGREHGTNFTKAIAKLTTGITRNTIDLVGVVGYMPKLLGQDLPIQFIEILKLIRKNEVRLPNDINSSIDTILTFVRQSEENGITERLFGPIIKFVPNLFVGTNDFLITMFTSIFNVLGANNVE